MKCPASIEPSINGLKKKYPEFNYSWNALKKVSIIRETLEKLDENASRLTGIKNICKKHWNFESDCEYDSVVKSISRIFSDSKSKYVSEFSKKLPELFSKGIPQPSVDQFMTKTTKKMVEKSFKITFETYITTINLLMNNFSEEDMSKVLNQVIQLNKSSS
jgi:glutamyl-tRNA reductase